MRKPWSHIVSLSIVVLAVAYWTIIRSPPLPIQVSQRTISVEGTQREYRLVVPTSLSGEADPAPKLPVVIALHGALDTTDEMAAYTDLDRMCAKETFLLVYLQGRLLNWPPDIPEGNPTHIDPDIKFFHATCDLLEAELGADPNRIYVVGVSQGGGMANLLAAKCSERIAAAVCNCGWLPKPLGETPLNTQYKCPMLFVSGTEDRQVPMETVRKAHDAFQRDGHPVEFTSIDGAGHGWGKQHGVNEIVWAFLSKHTRKVQILNE